MEKNNSHWKFYTGVVLIVLNFLLGFIAKASVIEFIVTGRIDWVYLGIYAISWVMLFVGIFLLGKETMEVIDAYIKKRVKEALDKASSEGKRHMKNVKDAAGRAYTKIKKR